MTKGSIEILKTPSRPTAGRSGRQKNDYWTNAIWPLKTIKK